MQGGHSLAPARRVGRLHVRASLPEDAQRATTLLADALHTATVPYVGPGKMLVVRRLALGSIAPTGSPATLSLHVERALREVAATAVPFDWPAARHANAVILPVHSAAIVALAYLHARGVEAKEWFWPAVTPAWRGVLARGERWLALIEAAHALPEAVLVAVAIVEEAVRAGVEDELLAAVPPGRGAAWLQLEGWSSISSKGTELATPALTPNHEEIIRRWQRRWGSSKELGWMGTMLALIEQPARAADPRLPARIAAWLADDYGRTDSALRQFGQSVDPAVEVAEESVVRSAVPPLSEPHFPLVAAETASDREEFLPTTIPGIESEPMPEGKSFVPPIRSEAQQAKAAHLAGNFTTFAGLLFLVPVLERLGFSEFLAACPVLLECGFPATFLRFVGERVGLRAHDPLAITIGAHDPSIIAESAWQLPAQAREILAHPARRTRLDSPIIAWITAIRRWCRRKARIGIASLVCRPGYVAASRMHLDVSFDLATADLRVRRCALDVDPGWVPWLGRVVRFHYLESHELSV